VGAHRVKDKGRPHLFSSKNSDKDLAASHSYIVWNLTTSLGFESNIPFSCVNSFVEAALHLSYTDAECAHKHSDGGVCDVMWHPNEADDQRVMANIHDRDMDAPHIETILCHVGEALLVAEADEDAVAREADPLDLTQPGIKLPL
jgi:hypothetical protein